MCISVVDIRVYESHELAIIKNVLIRACYGIELCIPLGHSGRCSSGTSRETVRGR